MLKILIGLFLWQRFIWNSEIKQHYLILFVGVCCALLYFVNINYYWNLPQFNQLNQVYFKSFLVMNFSNFFFNFLFFGYTLVVFNFCLNLFTPKVIVIFFFYYIENIYVLKPIIFFPSLEIGLNLNLINPLIVIHPLLLFTSIFFFYLIKFNNWLNVFCRNLSGLNFFSPLIFVQQLLLLTFFLGSWWAAQELNWGFWWNWDIVELSLLILVVNIVFFNHQILLIPNNNVGGRFILFYNCAQLVCYFLLTKIDIFSSVHSFNVFTFLEKWFPLFFISWTLLFVKIIFNFISNLKFFKPNTPIIYIFYSWFLLSASFMYFLITIFFSNFVFTEDLIFLKTALMWLIFNIQFYFKIVIVYILCSLFNFPLQIITLCVVSFCLIFRINFFFFTHYIFLIFFLDCSFKLFISSYLININHLKLSFGLDLVMFKYWCTSKILCTVWVDTLWYKDYGLFFFDKNVFFFKTMLYFFSGLMTYWVGFLFLPLIMCQIEFFQHSYIFMILVLNYIIFSFVFKIFFRHKFKSDII